MINDCILEIERCFHAFGVVSPHVSKLIKTLDASLILLELGMLHVNTAVFTEPVHLVKQFEHEEVSICNILSDDKVLGAEECSQLLSSLIKHTLKLFGVAFLVDVL